MASNTISPSSAATKNLKSATATEIAAAIIAPLASLKLTVFLLTLATAVIFIATVQQSRMDMWTVKNMHYGNWFVAINYQVLFVERWFPNLQNVPGKFYIPSGKLIIYALLINIVSAHIMRFKIKATGVKLWLGLATGCVAALVTWAMTFDTLGSDGFQKAPPISYKQMWLALQVILLGLSLGCVAGIFLTEKDKRIEKTMLGAFAFMGLAALGTIVYLGEDAFIGDSGMRILWQLGQATVAACVAWGACIILFQRKAGIVLLHFGIAGLMVNELYVTYTNKETRISFSEGQSTSLAIDLRETEFVIIDQSDPEVDQITVVPESILRGGETVSNQDIPFDIACVEFFDNSQLRRRGEPTDEFSGIGRRFDTISMPVSTSDQVDTASAIVELTDKSGTSLGKYVVSQLTYDQDVVDNVTVDGKSYQIGLRFKTEYKPYSLKLEDVSAKYYVGTTTPKWFSSDIALTDLETNTETKKQIYMNNPMRYGGETFYQASYDNSRGVEMSAIQIVKNHGWMIPYICCMFTVVGLAGQFGSSLIAHLKKSKGRVAPEAIPEASLVEDNASLPLSRRLLNRAPLISTVAVVGFFALYVLSGYSKATRPLLHEDGMRLDRFGEIPIASEGRVQPLDSFARNTARQFSKRELVLDGNFEKQPAIRWLADTLFEADGHDDYRTYRIEDLEVLQNLNLPAVAGPGEPKDARFRFSAKQLDDAPAQIRSLLPDPDLVPVSQWSRFQSRMARINGQLQLTMALRQLFGKTGDDSMVLAERIFRQGSFDGLPRNIPTGDAANPWDSMVKADNQAWLQSKAKQLNVSTVTSLYGKLIESDEELAEFRSRMLLEKINEQIMTPQRIAQARKDGATTGEQLVKKVMEAVPASQRTQLVQSAATEIDGSFHTQLTTMNGGQEDIDTAAESVGTELAVLFGQMGAAYRSGDAETFNSLTEDYLSAASNASEVSSNSGKLAVEKVYNGWAPFYLCMVIYLIGFLAVKASWITSAFSPKLTKTFWGIAFGLTALALTVQFAGLGMRVYISGRPPTTNLYSSAITVSLVFVAVLLLVEMMTKIGIGIAMACNGAFGALMWAWTMAVVDGDTFTVLVAVLDTQFWLSTHVVCITIGYSLMFVAGFIAMATIVASMVTPVMNKPKRKRFSDIIYGVSCAALFFSFFGTVLGGLWGDDSWGRFWGWDPKENGALMIVLWGALLLHARWGGLVRDRGIAILAVLGNVIVLWSWKGVNSMGVGLHAYSGTSEDTTLSIMVLIGLFHVAIALVALIPTKYWFSHMRDESNFARKKPWLNPQGSGKK